MSGTVVFAQEQRQIKEEGKTVFKPHWFIQAQVGAAHTVGEAKFTDLMSPAAAINIGYKFAPAFGARIGGSGWQAKGGWVTPEQTYQYKYLQGNIDIMADLSTLFCGFNPKRVFNGYLFGGVGLNRGFDNEKRMHSTPAPMNWNISGKKASFLSPDVLAWVVTFA